MKNVQGILALMAGLLGMGMASAQDMDIQGDGSNGMIILQGKSLSTGAGDRIGVQGLSAPIGWWGIGVKGIGGYQGVLGIANLTTNAGYRVGVEGNASNGASNFGVRGFATGGTGTNIGVYGEASGTNSRAGKFVGDLEYTGALRGPSDRKLKRNIREIRNCNNIVSQLAPKEFDYRTDEFPEMNLEKTHQMGLIAQDVERVLPDLVAESAPVSSPEDDKAAKTGSAPRKKEAYKTVNYMGLIPVLIGAVQEQQDQIDALTKQLAKLQK